MSNSNENIIDLYDHFRDKRSDSLSRHLNNGVRVDNQQWSKKKREEYRIRKEQEKAQ